MTREDYLLMYLKSKDTLIDFIYNMENPCPILRKLVLELGDPELAEEYAIQFRIYTDAELIELIEKLGACSFWAISYKHPHRHDRDVFYEDEWWDEEEESVWEGYEGKGWKYK